jgi:DNA-directed RNA polymerase subunit RPC12/RpoP
MSFKSRQKKRAIKKAQNDHRDLISGRHYLTIVSRPCSCNPCGKALRERHECVYRHTPREIRCPGCAERQKLKPRPSQQWEKSRLRDLKARGRKAAAKPALTVDDDRPIEPRQRQTG